MYRFENYFSGIAGSEGYTTKMEDWASVNRATFSTHGVNGIDKSSIETDIKYSQVNLNEYD